MSIADQDTDLVGLSDINGDIHTFKKLNKRKWKSDRDRDETVKQLYDELRSKKVPITNKNLLSLGLGRSTISANKKSASDQFWEQAENVVRDDNDDDASDDDDIPMVAVDRTLRDGEGPKAILPVGTKVIGLNNDKASLNTQRTQVKRNIDVFGEENVIDMDETCEPPNRVNKKKR